MQNNMELGYEMFCYQCEQTANGKGCYPSGCVWKDTGGGQFTGSTHFSVKGH